MKVCYGLVVIAVLATAASTPRHDWSLGSLKEADGFEGNYSEAEIASHPACSAEIQSEPPPSDRPTVAERTALHGCDAEALLYGIGAPADPVTARKCAIIEREARLAPNAPVLGPGGDYYLGSGILVVIYANGKGVPRNDDVATHMACEIDDAPAAANGRIEALVARRARIPAEGEFGICDNATSGIAAGFCADHRARLAQQARQQRIARLARGWTAAQRALFNSAYESMKAYAAVAHEMNCYGGTAHAACSIAGADADVEEFLRRIEALAAGKVALGDGRGDGPRSPATEAFDLSVISADEQPTREANYDAAVAARARLERELLVFMQATWPRFTRHDARAMFRDI